MVAPATEQATGARGAPLRRGHAPSVVDLRRRVVRLMVFRVVLITLVFGTTLALHAATPDDLTLPGAVLLLGIVATTFALTGVAAYALRLGVSPRRVADAQTAADLAITTLLVHATGGAQSGYAFFYPLSIIGAALLRHRRGAVLVGLVSVGLFTAVAVAGWMRWLPTATGQQPLPWEISRSMLLRQLVLNDGAFVAIMVLSAFLGQQLAHAGERLETQRVRTADLAALNQHIIRCLTSGLLTVDRQGVVLTCNEFAARILGVPASRVTGEPLGGILPNIEALLEGLDEHDLVKRAEIREQIGDVERTLGVSVSRLADHRDAPIGRIISFQDLTELRRMEQQVARAQRLAIVGQTTASVAHEIRNPLAAISGSIELLRGAPQVDAEHRALMDIVLREVDRMNGLVTELLDYARPRPPVPMPVDLAALVADTVRMFEHDRSNPSISVTLAPATAPEGVAAVVDPQQIRQVIWNLLRNAAEAMPDGGQIRVRLAGSPEAPAGQVEIGVSDEGQGIAREDLERIFDPFFTTKKRGTGLGLATVHRIVTDHGGTIAVEPREGGGTIMRIALPVAPPVVGGSMAGNRRSP